MGSPRGRSSTSCRGLRADGGPAGRGPGRAVRALSVEVSRRMEDREREATPEVRSCGTRLSAKTPPHTGRKHALRAAVAWIRARVRRGRRYRLRLALARRLARARVPLCARSDGRRALRATGRLRRREAGPAGRRAGSRSRLSVLVSLDIPSCSSRCTPSSDCSSLPIRYG